MIQRNWKKIVAGVVVGAGVALGLIQLTAEQQSGLIETILAWFR